MGAIRTMGGVWRSVGGASPSWSPPASAPSSLAVTIAESALVFGDAANAAPSVLGYPTPAIAYQWTLDGVDIDGQTDQVLDGVPVGALRVRVTATNSEGSAGPVTSAPVTVSALSPGAFSLGQWSADASGVSGEVALTLLGLPPGNGGGVSGVEYNIDGGAWTDFSALTAAAPWADLSTTKTWASTQAAQDWTTTSAVAPFVIYQSPWGAWDMAPGDVFNAELRADQTLSPAWPALRTITGPLQFGSGLPKGAPMIILGAHFDLTSSPNPFTTGGLRGIRSDAITEWRAATRLRDRSEASASLNAAVQTYATVVPTQVAGWADQNTEQWFDIQVRHWWPNFPDPPSERLRGTVTLGGVEYRIYRNPTEGTVRPGSGTIGYGVIPTRQTLLAQHDMKAIIDWIVADHNAVTAQSLPGLYIYQCATWVEPRSGVIDATTEGFEVRFNGATYGRLNRTEGGVALNTAYAVAGLTNDQLYAFRLRAVNAAGAGPESDVKQEAPFVPVAPDAPGDNGWTFQPVAASTDLEAFIAQTPSWTGLSLNVDGAGAKTATFAALETGPVNLTAAAIGGTPALGAVMTADAGRWASLTGVTGYAYQWRRDGVDIGGATAATYTLVSADSGTSLTVVVTATDAQGSTASTSAATAIGAFTPDLFPAATGALLNANAYALGDAAWSNNGNIGATALTADGPYLSPRRVTLTTGTDFFRGRLTSVGSPVAGTPYLVSAIVKPSTGGRATLRTETGGGTLRAEVFTTTMNSVGGSSGPITGAAVVDVGGGYVRISYTYTPAATEAANIKIGPAGGATGNAVDVYGCGIAEAV